MLKVFVYWNLPRMLECKALQAKRGRVVAHASSLSPDRLHLQGIGSRQRVIKRKTACWRGGHVGRRDSWRGSAVVQL
jgi:hypothetical protein